MLYSESEVEVEVETHGPVTISLSIDVCVCGCMCIWFLTQAQYLTLHSFISPRWLLGPPGTVNQGRLPKPMCEAIVRIVRSLKVLSIRAANHPNMSFNGCSVCPWILYSNSPYGSREH